MTYPPYKLDCGIKLNSITSINNKRKILTRPNLEVCIVPIDYFLYYRYRTAIIRYLWNSCDYGNETDEMFNTGRKNKGFYIGILILVFKMISLPQHYVQTEFKNSNTLFGIWLSVSRLIKTPKSMDKHRIKI
jgi:hypothetical protein